MQDIQVLFTALIYHWSFVTEYAEDIQFLFTALIITVPLLLNMQKITLWLILVPYNYSMLEVYPE
jgi:hypothetical protein